MKDDDPFRHTLGTSGMETHISQWSEALWPATLITTPQRCSFTYMR